MKAAERFESSRLVFKRPVVDDDRSMLERYAGDPEVTRYLSWPRHTSVADTRAFLGVCDDDWRRWPAGPYLIYSRYGSRHGSRDGGELLGSTGLAFDSADRAATGYVLARDAWGKGYATEALQAMVGVARAVGVRHLYALCHPDHLTSARVLVKCGFQLEAIRPRHSEFPNLNPGQVTPGQLADVHSYAMTLVAVPLPLSS